MSDISLELIPSNGSFELLMLVIAIIIGLINLVWTSAAAQPQRGLEWNVGPRDTPVELTGVAGRLQRAFANYRETFPLFAGALIAVYLAGKIGALSHWAAFLYVLARLVYLPLYAFGVKWARTLVWAIAFGSIIALLVAFFR